MVEEEVISRELKEALGDEAEPGIIEVEKGHMKRFAEALDDPNPLWQDEEYAKKSRYGSIIGPPTYPGGSKIADLIHRVQALPGPLKRHLYGGSEYEFHKPIKPGDVLHTKGRFADMFIKEGRMGKLLFMVFEGSMTNQRGELVTKYKHYFIQFR